MGYELDTRVRREMFRGSEEVSTHTNLTYGMY
jgi:hypothetical protein